MPSELDAVSPIDGRYHERTAALAPYLSEAALMQARVRVEVEYLIHLADVAAVDVALSEAELTDLRDIYESFDNADASRIKQLETEGYGQYPATNHDVKAVEYFLRLRTPDRLHPWLHFGLTSEDVNNLAYRLLIRDAVTEVLLPHLSRIVDQLDSFATTYRDLPMLARTHGQPATPTTFGKEMAVVANRLERTIGDIETKCAKLAGKLAGASGTYAAHHVAYPTVDWPTVAETFVTGLGLAYLPATTQINPGDDLAALFHAFVRANQVIVDLDRDCWRYISDGYLGQAAGDGETGSSTMPHKINPIDFENSEGNLSKATADLTFLAESITTSRLQRDLSDSTVKRNIGTAFAHCLLGYQKTHTGLESIVPNERAMAADLEATPEVIAEALQTLLRKAGQADAYEQVKTITRGQSLTHEELTDQLADLDVPPAVADQIAELTPAEYIGLATDVADTRY